TENIAKLKSFGNIIIAPGSGELASGLVGEGRMEEPEQIVEFLINHLKTGAPLYGKKAVVTAGPTYEAIDPVRFIGNHASGKMGFAIAEALHNLGASVTLITGPTAEKIRDVERIDVVSAKDMLDATLLDAHADIIVMSAAVADYTPADPAKEKIKKAEGGITLELAKTTDILSELGKRKPAGQILVGFALETHNEEAFALDKLKKKNLDMVVLNSLNDAGAGFKTDTNKITIYNNRQEKKEFTVKSKSAVAADICSEIIHLLAK
ncbi:MAG: bifunctional phosphopantothenoylcysteine decarboxylase/phosphopantothenate--cysteine ligase CoaBC, partial [Sphingobacteriales bacterium]